MKRKALKAAFPYTIPIFAGFCFLGMAYGIYMNVSEFSFWYPMWISLLVFGGSLEFIMVSLLLSPFAPVSVFMAAFLLQARHLFYGISMLDWFKGLGWKRYYLIFGMCDETFTINYTSQVPEGIDQGWFMFFVTLLNHLYWVTGATLGGLLGPIIPFDTTGLEFVMTAMFSVILFERWKENPKNPSLYIGLGMAIICLLVLGSQSFMLPTMLGVVLILLAFRPKIEVSNQEDET